MDSIVDRLRSLILSGSIKPGTVLPQEELAQSLGVSRTPLREALFALEQEGLIGFSPSRVASVIELSTRDAEELMEMREIMDGLAARKLATRGLPDETASRLLDLIETMEQANQRGDKDRYLRANTAFHVEIVTATEHRQLMRHLAVIKMASEVVYLDSGPEHHERLRRGALEHREILEAIADHQPDRAESIARAHIRNASRHWVAPDPAAPTASADPAAEERPT